MPTPNWFDGALNENPELGLPVEADGGAEVTGVLTAPLGALVATATGTRTVNATLTAPLGSLTATLTGTVEPPTPAAATPYITEGGTIPRQELPKPPVPTRHIGFAHAQLGPLNAELSGTTTFSIVEDEQELLLLI